MSEKNITGKKDKYFCDNSETRQDNLDTLQRMAGYCREQGIRVIVAVAPLSDAFLWKHTGLDDFLAMLRKFYADNQCEFYDLNLDRERYSLYSDDHSFWDETHLSSVGAEAMTARFCELIRKTGSGEDIRGSFYSGYEEIKQDSPYTEYTK